MNYWYEIYKKNKAYKYYQILLNLERNQKHPHFSQILEEEPFSDFILSKDLNLGQEVKEHEHQIIYCLTKFDWTCNNCHKNYESSKPTHFCSLCDYNMCDELINKSNNQIKDEFKDIKPIKSNKKNEDQIKKQEINGESKIDNDKYK